MGGFGGADGAGLVIQGVCGVAGSRGVWEVQEMKLSVRDRRFPGYRAVGRVADYCPVCRDVQPHRLLRPGPARMDREREHAPEGITCCESCGSALSRDPYTYTRAETDARLGLEELSRRTSPLLASQYRARLALEMRAGAGQAHCDERTALIREAFEFAQIMAELARWWTRGEAARGRAALIAAGASVAWSFLMLGLYWALATWLARHLGFYGAPAMAAVWAGGAGVMWCSALLLPRVAPRSALADTKRRLEAMLRPIEPFPEEVAQVLDDLSSLGQDWRWATPLDVRGTLVHLRREGGAVLGAAAGAKRRESHDDDAGERVAA